jgi:hypothetical protein
MYGKRRFSSEGIVTFLLDEMTSSTMPVWNMAIGGIKLVVADEVYEEAVIKLKEFEKDYAKSATCPNCKKSGLEYLPKKSGLNFFMAIGTWLFGSYSMAVDYVYICSKCGLELASLPPLAR